MNNTQSLTAARQVDPAPPAWPKLLYNVNMPPKLAYSLDQVAAMGDSWRAFDLAPFFPGVPGVTIEPESESFPAGGGNATVTVTINSAGQSGTWTVDKDATADWITVTAPIAPQSEDGEVRYTVAPNTSGASRTGNLYINGKTHTVTQAEVGG